MVNKRRLTAASWPVWKFYETAISDEMQQSYTNGIFFQWFS